MMRTCASCKYGAITSSVEGYAKDNKMKAEKLNFRYCLLSRDFTNFTIPQKKEQAYFDCDDFKKNDDKN